MTEAGPEPSAPEQPASERPAPEQPAPERPASERPASEQPAPEQAAPERPAAEPATPAAPAADEAKWRRPRGRDRSSAPKRMFFVAPLAVAGALLLAGCSPQYWPQSWTGAEVSPTGTPTSTADAAIIEEGAAMPALSEAKVVEISADAAEVAAAADEARDAALLAPRFAGDALAERAALYRAQQADGALAGPVPFPTGEPVYVVPEASADWPRTVVAVVTATAGESTAAPFAVALRQETPRDQFLVHSLVQLAPGVTLPEAPSAEIGSGSLDSVAGDLAIAPDELAAAYADLIAKGDASPNAQRFDAENDLLRDQVDQAYRDAETAKLDPQVATIEFAYAASTTPPIGIATLDGGAIVAVSITERETIRAVNDRSRITMAGRTKALAGVETSPYGFQRTYRDQVLFYVPTAASGDRITYLGSSQTMTEAKELTQEEANISG